jgi:hypothetical protein
VTSTSGGGVANAKVAFADGANAGKQGTSDAGGNYSISGLASGGYTVTVSASNYFQTTHGVAIGAGANTLNIQLQPTPIFQQSGVGNTVVDLPTSVVRLHIVGTYTACCSNFVVWDGPNTVNCDSTFNVNCRLLVNDLVGSAYGRTVSDGTYITTGGNSLQIVDSAGVSWSVTEVR